MDNQCGEKEKKAKDIQEEGGERMLREKIRVKRRGMVRASCLG